MQMAKHKLKVQLSVTVKQETKPLDLHFGRVVSSSSVEENDYSIETTNIVVPPILPLPLA